ncbi:hypothetical protein ACFWIY_23005 [Streptomyces sioyaensis]|uniref:hypothetical protein n=1 Tax=Streptomyces sioyaensis TaxID=67364 RepID=UPI00365817CA
MAEAAARTAFRAPSVEVAHQKSRYLAGGGAGSRRSRAATQDPGFPVRLNLGGMYGGLWVMFRGWRDERGRLVTLGGWCMAASLALCLVVLSLLP